MEIYNSEKFLKERLKEEALYPFNFSKRIKSQSLNKREVLCLQLHTFCKNLYEGNPLPTNDDKQYFNKNFIKQSNGWYLINKPYAKGMFINANAFLGDKIYCEEEKCHLSAYNFALHSSFSVDLSFGTINPFNIANGLFHSICIFNYDGKEMVFDGANYLIIEKELFDKIFNYKEIQKISKLTLIKDRKNLATKSIIKNNLKYKLVNYKFLYSRFYGLGFITYLYNRADFLKNTEKQIKNIKQIKKDFAKFEEEIDKIEEKI